MRDQRFRGDKVRYHHKVVQTHTTLADRPHTPIVQPTFEYGKRFRWRIQTIGDLARGSNRTGADHLLPTTKVLVASPTQRAYGITSHLRRSSPADDQLFFSGSDITISYMQTLSQPASIGWTAARAQPEAATTERNQLGRLSWRPPTRWECHDRHAGEAHSRNATESC